MVTARTLENDCCYNYRMNGQWSSFLAGSTSQKSLQLLQHKKSLSYLVHIASIGQFAWALNSLHHYMVVMLCVTRPFPSIPDYNDRWTQTETRANRQTELDVDHMLQWPTNWQARLLAHYEILENWQWVLSKTAVELFSFADVCECTCVHCIGYTRDAHKRLWQMADGSQTETRTVPVSSRRDRSRWAGDEENPMGMRKLLWVLSEMAVNFIC